MLSEDELGQTMVLLMRRKHDEANLDSQGTDNNQQKPLPNPFIITTSIDLAVGPSAATDYTITKEGRGSRCLIRTNSKTVFNKSIQITQLTDGTNVEVISHPTMNVVQGVVYEPDSTDVDEKTLLNYLQPHGVQAVRRITKRVDKAVRNTPLIVLTFHGTILPEFILFGRLRVPVRAYYPAPMICFNCGTYGHPRKFCEQTSICVQCSKTHVLAEGEQCNNPFYCKHCKGPHSFSSRSCPKCKDEENIIRMRIDRKISAAEARKIYYEETTKETIASEIQKRLDQSESAKDKIIAELRAEVESLKTKLNTVLNEFKKRTSNDSLKETRPQLPLTPVTPVATSSGPNQNVQRQSRKDRTFKSPPNTTKKNNSSVANVEIRTRSKSRKHTMEISPTNFPHSQVKRPSLPPDDDSTIAVDE